ncbi:TetR/AcrR family transcriptional regulator [Mariniluteicoccus flavus]
MTRAYNSPARARRAEETRDRIAAAARECFLADGFHATSVAQVARLAGTSAQTVHTHFGSKGALVAAVLAGLEADAGADEWRERISASPTAAERLDAWARWTATILGPARSMAPVVRDAASEPALVELKQAGDGQRRAAVDDLASGLAASGDLRAGVSQEAAADQLWMLCGLEVYLLGVDCGWTDDAYADWLSETLRRTLLETD